MPELPRERIGGLPQLLNDAEHEQDDHRTIQQCPLRIA
jgi:hypothetical protein